MVLSFPYIEFNYDQKRKCAELLLARRQEEACSQGYLKPEGWPCPGSLCSGDDRDLEGPALPINTAQTRLRTWGRQAPVLSQITDSEHCPQDPKSPSTTPLCPQVPPPAWTLSCSTCHCLSGPQPGLTWLSDGLFRQGNCSPGRPLHTPTFRSGSHSPHSTAHLSNSLPVGE